MNLFILIEKLSRDYVEGKKLTYASQFYYIEQCEAVGKGVIICKHL
jgi:hypothetical protein